MTAVKPFLSLLNITVRHLNQILFRELDFTVNQGEHWALVGENDSGKSDLLNALAGKLNVTGGSINRHFFEEFVKEAPPEDPYFNYNNLQALVTHRHAFRNLSNTTDFYYQQRYNSFDSEDAPTVKQYLEEQAAAGIKGHRNYNNTVETFKLQALQNKELIKLSNGETKRLLLAAAVIKNPKLLLLDQPLTGLDVESRAEFSSLLSGITASGITIIMATSPAEIPDALTHVAVIRNGKIVQQLPKKAFIPEEHQVSTALPEAGGLKELLLKQEERHFQTIVKMENASVSYGDNLVLDNISWEVKAGERWALLGPNGAGKTTLLSLINGDNPQAYANNIILFDRSRGSGESIWDIKKNIGFVSPELYQYFPVDQSCLQVVISGFFDTPGLFRMSSEEQKERAFRWMQVLKIEGEAENFLSFVPLSIQRLCLLARALVKNPPLLILDEPCQGLEQEQKQHFKAVLERVFAQSKTSLIYVTHYPNEIPESVTRTLRLHEGKVAEEL